MSEESLVLGLEGVYLFRVLLLWFEVGEVWGLSGGCDV